VSPSLPPSLAIGRSRSFAASLTNACATTVWRIDKLLARGEKLDHISTKAEDMQDRTKSFKKRTFEVRRYAWMKHFKACICLAGTVCCVCVTALCDSGRSTSTPLLTVCDGDGGVGDYLSDRVGDSIVLL
jgi:hypothetical protein